MLHIPKNVYAFWRWPFASWFEIHTYPVIICPNVCIWRRATSPFRERPIIWQHFDKTGVGSLFLNSTLTYQSFFYNYFLPILDGVSSNFRGWIRPCCRAQSWPPRTASVGSIDTKMLATFSSLPKTDSSALSAMKAHQSNENSASTDLIVRVPKLRLFAEITAKGRNVVVRAISDPGQFFLGFLSQMGRMAR